MQNLERALRLLIREAIEHDEVDWDRLRAMHHKDVEKLPPEMQTLGRIAVAARPKKGTPTQSVARSQIGVQAAYDAIDAIRDSRSHEEFREKMKEIEAENNSRGIHKWANPVLRDMSWHLEGDIDRIFRAIFRRYREEFDEELSHWDAPSISAPIKRYHWPDIKDWASRSSMASAGSMGLEFKNSENPVFPDAKLLSTDLDVEVKLIKLAPDLETLIGK